MQTDLRPEQLNGHHASDDVSKFVLGVDLDGVCADFTKGLKKIAAEWLEVPEGALIDATTKDYPEWKGLAEAGGFEALYRYAATRRDLFREIPPVEGASLALRRLWTKHRIRIRIITHRLYFEFSHRMVVDQTIDWLDRNDLPYWDLCFMKSKGDVFADLYVEDDMSNVRDLRTAKKEVIAFITPRNEELAPEGRHARSWDDVEKQVDEVFETWSLSH